MILITVNFFEDGAYVKGHDIQEVCNIVSYAMWLCINDCLDTNENVTYFESCNDTQWKSLGFTFIKIDVNEENHLKILSGFKNRLPYWIDTIYPSRVKINYYDKKLIDWDEALKDAKKEQGLSA